DESPRLLGDDELALGGAKFRSGYASDEGSPSHTGPNSPGEPKRSRKPRLILWDETLPAGTSQAVAELRGLVRGPERPYHGAVVDTLVAQIGTLDHGRLRSQDPWELALQRLERGLGIRLTPL